MIVLMPTELSWSDLLASPRHSAASLHGRDIPKSPGIYAWFKDGECVYVGMASVLRERLGKHLSRSLDLSRSTLRASIAVRQLGVSRAVARSRPTVMTPNQVQVVNDWLHTCDITWLERENVAAADELERRLRKEWMPPINLA